MNHSVQHVEHGSATRPAIAATHAWIVFRRRLRLMVFDYVDRQVIVSMFPHLKAQWSLSDSALGGLVSIISITVAILAVPLSLLADRWSRVKSIFVMALAWSIATIACAFAQSYFQLLFLRGIVGVGEAAYGTAGAALLAGLFPERMRTPPSGVPSWARESWAPSRAWSWADTSGSTGDGRRASASWAFPAWCSRSSSSSWCATMLPSRRRAR